MDFDEYVRGLGYTGRIPKQVAVQLHSQWLKSGGRQEFQPSAGNVTNNVTGDVSRYFMTSPNSAQLMPEPKDASAYKVDPEGYLYSASGNSANYVTNAVTGERMKAREGQADVDPVVKRMADMELLNKARKTGDYTYFTGDKKETSAKPTSTPPLDVEPSNVRKVINYFFGAQASPKLEAVATPEPTPTSPPRPMPVLASPEMKAEGAGASWSREQVKAAFRAGQIGREEAMRLLQE